MTCPSCNRPLTLFYSESREAIRCLCENPDCVLRQKGVVGEGNSTQEAVDALNWKAARYERKEAV